ncbi:hypothetical protein IW01_10905 [Pectobacterium brasiliense]|uniref:hypothetical protein n=1 Tax=Pectobacterium brasiliense TaxID=180957 RepID=UPI0004E7568F|nr:hypothetical protein [Pectobacterium brasiliense]KFF70319.1 hypothetical protein IW01_10905 [Pectobacterium brasiliense]
MKSETWQIKARLPIELKESMYSIAKNHERSINYLFIKAVSEYIIKYGEAPTAGTVRASISSPSKQG